MGTPDIAGKCLDAILKAKYDICGVFTREDKPVGRKQTLTAPPVKQLAIKHNLQVFQPRAFDEKAIEIVQQLTPDLIVVVAYGRILPIEILQIPKFGTINLHVSLLPKYRGAAPVQWAIINGEVETGVSIMYLDEGLDTGDIIRQRLIEITENETAGQLFEKVTQIGIEELLCAMDDIEKGFAISIPQNHTEATYAPVIKKEMSKISFTENANTIHNLVRGMNPWPIAYFLSDGKRVKVIETEKKINMTGPEGTILSINPLIIACGKDAIELKKVVPEGSAPMDGKSWAFGKRFSVGDKVDVN